MVTDVRAPQQMLEPAWALTSCGRVVGQYTPGGAFYLLTSCCRLPASPVGDADVCDGCYTTLPRSLTGVPMTVRELARALEQLHHCPHPLECAATAAWRAQTLNREQKGT